MTLAADRLAAQDAADPFARFREQFMIPDGIIYLDGNSLGCMPKAARCRLDAVMDTEWAGGLIRSWVDAGWFHLPLAVGDRIAPLVGAGPGEIAVGDSTSVNLFKCLAAALALRPGRRVILAEEDNFPTDTYMAQGLAALLPGVEVRYCRPAESLQAGLDHDVAVLILSHIHYRTAEIRDLAAITAAAHRAGALAIWDLSHSTGAVPVELPAAGADFAVGCTYKYLNGGPGSPAFVWANPALAGLVTQPLSGWMGHRQPFAFDRDYAPGAAVRRFVCGTPQILSLAVLDECLKLWAEVDMIRLREKSQRMTELFIQRVESGCSAHGLVLASPRDPERRGSHVAFRLETGYPVIRALADRGVIGDFRAPDVMRFGFAPLYLSFAEVERAAEALKQVLDERLWDKDAYRTRAEVT